jgi:dihydrofolate synthase / folylpolyglutamate synthase
MNYEESVRALLSLGRELAAPRQFARSGAAGAHAQKFGLDNITILAEALGNPHRAAPCVHIAGTNGKGSTAAMLESILRAGGLRTGLYTSPHLTRINERIRINGEDVSDEKFGAAWTRVQAAIEALMAFGRLAAHPSFFECLTAIAFLIFAEEQADLVVYEVGMGGRLDATNIVVPDVAVITPIAFDHENFLGHSIEEIAAEKAGIIKPGAYVVSSIDDSKARDVIARRCTEQNARLVEVNSAWHVADAGVTNGFYRAKIVPVNSSKELALAPSLPGRFQIRNALAAATAARFLAERGFPVTDEAISRGIATAHWPGRLEKILDRPAVYLDGTHNPAGARELLNFWEEDFANRRIFLVYGSVRDKAVDEIAGLLFPRAEVVILTEPRQPRAISVLLLAEMTSHLAKEFSVMRDPSEALQHAIELAQPQDAVFVTGSLYLVGDLRGEISEHRRKTGCSDPAPAPVSSSQTS